MKKSLLGLISILSLCVLSACGGSSTPPPATHFSVTAPASATAGTAFNLTVTALDASNRMTTNYSGTAHFTSTDGQAVLPANSMLTNGMGTFSVTLKSAGSQSITATDTITASITGTSSSISVAPGTASHFSVTAPGTANVGVAFNLAVTALDASNNMAASYSGTVHFTSTDGQAVLPTNATLTNGTGTFSVTLKTAGPQTITATDTATASITGTSNSVTVSGATGATHFSVTAPGAATIGTAFNFTVTALDASNNTVTTYSGTVHFTSTDNQADLPGKSTITNGTATFPASLKTLGPQTITATDTATASITGTSSPINVSGAAAANPVPLINQPLSPDAVAPGVASFTLTVNGTGFVSGSVVHWNGSARATNFISNSKLTATVSASDVASFNTAWVTVFNPAPGGGTSNVVFFVTTRPTSSVALGTPLEFATGSDPLSVATGDFNGDGKLDLAVANSGSNNVSVLLGKGDGTFQTAVNYDAGLNPQCVAVGDFNADGKLDLAVVNGSNGIGSVSILLGKGDGTFQAAVSYGVGLQPISVAVADFNGDGKLDLAVVNTSTSSNGSVSILLGKGDGTFQAALSFDVGTFPFSVAVGDFNGDDRLDLAVVNFGNSTVSVLIGNGDGTFQAAVDYGGGNAPVSVAVADFNSDGKLDLAVANLSSGNVGPGNVSVLLGKGDGTFQPAVSYGAGSNTDVASVAAGDFSGDGRLDLVVATGGTNSANNLSILMGNGDGTFQPAVNYGTGSNPFMAVGDFNRDGRLDIAVVDLGGSGISVLLQPGLVSGPNAFLSPDSLTFATQLLGTTSAAQPVQLSNYGTTILTITNIATTTNFGETDDCGSSLAPGASCTIIVTFTPTTAGNLAGTLSVTDNAPGSPQSVSLVGQGTGVELTPSRLLFVCRNVVNAGCQCINSRMATLTNVGSTPLDITNITTTGPFQETNNCPMSLGAGQFCTINVKWSEIGGSGLLSIFDNVVGSPQTVGLFGLKECSPPTAGARVAASTEPNSGSSTCRTTVSGTPLSDSLATK